MLELFDKYFKALIIKMLQQVRRNAFEMKDGSLTKDIGNIKSQMGILELKKIQ